MDKETLSNYGWVIILTLILSFMLALATPLGDYIASAVISTVKGYGFANEQAIDEDSIKAKSEEYAKRLNRYDETVSEPCAVFKNADGTRTTLTWEELKDIANGSKYGYGASSISDTSIDDYAFCECYSLTSITIPSGVTSIGAGAFLYCESLTSVTIPNSVTSIGETAFFECCSLTSITIPNSVTSIDGQAFDRCTSLTSVTIPNSVTSIGEYAFFECCSLTSITIPNSVTSIRFSAFQHCTSLTDIYYDSTQSQWNSITKGNSWNSSTGNYTIHCTDGNLAKS